MNKLYAFGTVKDIGPADEFPGTFEVILSTPELDRDGEIVAKGAFDPLPDHVSFDIDHGMSVATTVGSGVPRYDGDVLKVDGTWSSIPEAQKVRTLVREGHVRSTSVAFMGAKYEDRDGTPTIVKAEILNGAFTPIPSNRGAAVLSAKTFAEKVSTLDDDAIARVAKAVVHELMKLEEKEAPKSAESGDRSEKSAPSPDDAASALAEARAAIAQGEAALALI